jgi:hypothetical protein
VLNFGKAAMLACLAASALWLSTVQEALLDTETVRTIGQQKTLMVQVVQIMIFYVAIDFLALFMVPKLPATSARHHVATVALTLMIAPLDIFINDTARMVLVYVTLSTVAYLVNAYLGVYKVYKDLDDTVMLNKRRLRFLAALALLIYIAECCFNWSVQTHWYASTHLTTLVAACWNGEPIHYLTVSATIYFIIMLVVFVRDDLILAKALWRTAAAPMAPKQVAPPVQVEEKEKELLQVIESVAAINNGAAAVDTSDGKQTQKGPYY